MRGKWLLSGVVGLATLAGGWQAALAQGRGGFSGGGSGMSGSGMSRQSGGSSSRSVSGGSRQGMFGSRTTGGSIGAGNRTFGGMQGGSGSGMDTTAGQLSGNERFLRGNQQPGQFVGVDVGEFIGAVPGGGNQFDSGGSRRNRGQDRGRDRNRSDDNRRRNRDGRDGDSQSRRTTLPTRVVVAFDQPRPAPARAIAVLQRRLSRLEPMSNLDVTMQGRRAVLRGVVATDHDRDLAEQLIRLEPGIDAVQNELTVGAVLPAAASSSVGSRRADSAGTVLPGPVASGPNPIR